MSERCGGRYSRVSPSPGKGAIAAYTLCPLNDPDMLSGGNVLSIPLSAITLPSSSGKNANENSGEPKYRIMQAFPFFALVHLTLAEPIKIIRK